MRALGAAHVAKWRQRSRVGLPALPTTVPLMLSDPFLHTPQPLCLSLLGGRIVGGVVGTATPRFRLFGDTINTASRMCTRAACGEILVSHMFVEALGLPARDQPWGVAGDVLETELSHIAMRLMCDGPVAIKGKGMFTVWRFGGWPRLETSVHACVGTPLNDSSVQKNPADGGNDLFELLVHRQQEINDEGSVLARQMLTVAAEYRRISSSEPWEPSGSREQTSTLRGLYTALSDMLVCTHVLNVNAFPHISWRYDMLICMRNQCNKR